MDSYPQFDVSERECSSRRDSNSSSITKASHTLDTKSTQKGHFVPPQYTSFPPPSVAAEQERLRNDSVHSVLDTETKIAAKYAQYTDAPPPYSSKQYEGKSEEQQHKMRIADYAKELKRQGVEEWRDDNVVMLGHQTVGSWTVYFRRMYSTLGYAAGSDKDGRVPRRYLPLLGVSITSVCMS
jgi:hypothetical protein